MRSALTLAWGIAGTLIFLYLLPYVVAGIGTGLRELPRVLGF